MSTTTEQLQFCQECFLLEFLPERDWLEELPEQEQRLLEKNYETDRNKLISAISDDREFMHFADTENIDEFATTSCALCGTTLGGTRHTVKAVFCNKPLEEQNNKED